jgi:predicted nucleotidyltransferase
MTLESLRLKGSVIQKVATLHGVRNLRVFGSVATGQATDHSDIDFLVEMEAGRNIFDLGGLLADLKDLLGTRVDVVEVGSIHPYIRDRVLSESVPL